MTSTAQLLVDAFGRVREAVHGAVEGLDVEALAFRADSDANSIGWLAWHLTRVQDDHIAEVAGTEQVWLDEGWSGRLGLPFDPRATGYGQSSDEVAAVRVAADELLGYHDAVHARTVQFVQQITDADLDRVVDASWNPPVTLAVRLVSVVDDDLEHAGQAAYLRGILARRTG